VFAVRTPVRYPATEQAPLDVRVFMTKKERFARSLDFARDDDIKKKNTNNQN